MKKISLNGLWFDQYCIHPINVSHYYRWKLKKPVHERYTVLKSVHIYKKHRVQYEFRTYFSFVQYSRLTGSTADTLLEYVERNLPEGVALKATKVSYLFCPST